MLRQLPLAGTTLCRRSHRLGAVILVGFLPEADVSTGRGCSCPAGALVDHIGLQGQPAARAQRLDDVGSYAVDFASLLLLGPHETMLVAAASAYSQCTFRIKERNPTAPDAVQHGVPGAHRAGGGRVSTCCSRGSAGRVTESSTHAQPLVGAATTYFVVNTLTIATAIALTNRRQSIIKVWNENFLWSAPSYFVGALAAAGAAWMVRRISAHWLALLAARRST